MTDTLTPPRPPSVNNTQGQIAPRMITNKYGDGYKQDLADGVNPLERSYTLTWDPIGMGEADDIIAFLEAHVGTPFYYQLPREPAPRTWVWTSIARSYPLPVDDTLTVSIEERLVY